VVKESLVDESEKYTSVQVSEAVSEKEGEKDKEKEGSESEDIDIEKEINEAVDMIWDDHDADNSGYLDK
jgi:hypothetical protein